MVRVVTDPENRSFQGFQKGYFGPIFDQPLDPKLRLNWSNPWNGGGEVARGG